jgi:hypothetical protein
MEQGRGGKNLLSFISFLDFVVYATEFYVLIENASRIEEI